MCGIAGFIDASLNHDEKSIVLENMLEKIAHRGPDARGKWYHESVALGQNRLSIIDLSEDGNQPMHYQSASIVFNGEIYNYLEVREELKSKGYQFKTGSDTEVILAAYIEWGSKCVERFIGMWAIALWDHERQELFCSRDRFGIKPFYYIVKGDKFYFGSEYKALKPTSVFDGEWNLDQISMGLQLGWNHSQETTYYKSMQSLAAGCNLIYKNGKVTISEYWDIKTQPSINCSYEESVDLFRNAMNESIKLHMRSDVEVGCCLSGGLDSSTIASLVGKGFPETKFKAFNVYYEGKDSVDERPWVKEVIKKYPSIEPYYFSPTDDDIANAFERAIYHADVPLAGSSPISQYFVMQLAASKGIKVLLDGQGSDESLGGYMHSFYRLIGGMIKQGQIIEARNEISAHAQMQDFSGSKKTDLWLKSVLSAFSSEQKLYELEYKNYLPYLSNNKNIPFDLKKNDGSRLSQFLYQLNKNTLLPTLLQFEDRNSMAFSIESRVPFLDHRIVELAFRLPDSAKIYRGVTKRILRDSMKGILPEAIAERKDKKGFVTPGEVKWLRGPLKFLLDQDMSDIPFLDKSKTDMIMGDFKSGSNKYANLVWRLVVLKYWMGRN
jgi:asparagine synthase (glutamine-hydrolysing)